MIKITQYEGRWRISIINETWEFGDLKEMMNNLNKIIELKNKYGDIKNEMRKM